MISQTVLFWTCVVFLAYTYLGYPAVVHAWAKLRRQPCRWRNIEPTVSLVVVVHNEATRTEGRLKNLFALDFPRDRLEILIASDGSTDGTLEAARAYEDRGVTVIAFDTRRGKPAVLNDVIPKAQGEIVVLADARQHFEADTLLALVNPFADATVGAVSGELILTQPEGGRTSIEEGVGFYWRYETFIRRNESLVDSTVGATGAIYAIRKELFEPIPEDMILDDVLLPMRIARRGYRILFEPAARAYDRPAATANEEFTRKVRTIAGNFQLLAREHWLLNPFRNRLWLQTISHKVLRLLSPLFLTGVLVANLLLLNESFYRWTLGIQLAFYSAALGGCILHLARIRILATSVPYVFCLLNCATVVAFFRFVTGRQRVTWKKASL